MTPIHLTSGQLRDIYFYLQIVEIPKLDLKPKRESGCINIGGTLATFYRNSTIELTPQETIVEP